LSCKFCKLRSPAKRRLPLTIAWAHR
jgi:hypothetical protein